MAEEDAEDYVRDFCQTTHFQNLKNKGLLWEGRDLAFHLATNGVSLFKVSEHSVWPLILLNLNLPVDLRLKRHNIFLLGLMPGPKGPSNINTFLHDLLEEFLLLKAGVSC